MVTGPVIAADGPEPWISYAGVYGATQASPALKDMVKSEVMVSGGSTVSSSEILVPRTVSVHASPSAKSLVGSSV